MAAILASGGDDEARWGAEAVRARIPACRPARPVPPADAAACRCAAVCVCVCVWGGAHRRRQRVSHQIWWGHDVVVKERFAKTYRHPALDARLTRARIREVRAGPPRHR